MIKAFTTKCVLVTPKNLLCDIRTSDCNITEIQN